MRQHAGFTLIEMMIVVAIMAIFATMATPSYQDRVIRAQVSEGLVLSEFAQRSVEAYRARNGRLPKNNADAGLPPADAIVGNFVDAISLSEGVITITYGNRSNRHLRGMKLALRPAQVRQFPSVPIAWVCGNASVPARMEVVGTNTTNLPATQLPIDCR